MTRTFLVGLALAALLPMRFAGAQEARPAALADARRPALVLWGGAAGMTALAAPGAQWDFVRRHTDGCLLRASDWLAPNAAGAGRTLARLTRGSGARFLLQTQWPPVPATSAGYDTLGDASAQQVLGQIRAFQTQTGLPISEVQADLRLSIFREVAVRNEQFAAPSVAIQVAGSDWPDFRRALLVTRPDVAVSFAVAPDALPWDGQPGTSPDVPFTVTRPDDLGRPQAQKMTINGREVYAMLFAGDANGAVADCPGDTLANQGRVLSFARWVQERGKTFTLAGDSLSAFQQFQAGGGRADRYLVRGRAAQPLLPENAPGSVANTAKQTLLYLKGPGQVLDLATPANNPATLAVRAAPGHSVPVTLRLTNRGTVACLPALRVIPANVVARATVNGQDISPQLLTAEGCVLPALLPSGASVDVSVQISPLGERAGPGKATFQAFWNPQDPSGPRDTLAVTLNAPAPNHFLPARPAPQKRTKK